MALAGENLLLVSSKGGYGLYTIAYLEALPVSGPLMGDAGALNAGANNAAYNPTAILGMAYGQLAQWRAKILDDINVIVGQPSALARYATQSQTARWSRFLTLWELDYMTEFFMFENQIGQSPVFNVLNPTSKNIAHSRIAFYGFRFVLSGADNNISAGNSLKAKQHFSTIEEAKRSPVPWTQVNIAGWGV